MASPLFRVLQLDDGRLSLAVRRPLTAGALLEELGLSRPVRARVLADRRLVREGRPLAHGDALAAGDVAVLTLEPADPSWPDCAPAEVLWDDPLGLALVANKPQGILVHGDGTGSQTLTDRVQAYLAAAGRAQRAQAVQRIDTDTSGCVLFSLSQEFQPALDAQVADGSMEKRYLLAVRGRPQWHGALADIPVGRDRHDARRMHAGTGKEARTRFTALDTVAVPGTGPVTLAEARIETGRRHQVRVHAAALGFPVLGDTLYGGPRWRQGLMLHAASERFRHPLTQDPVQVEAPLPERFVEVFGQKGC